MGEISEDLHDDIEGLDASAAHIANLLSAEPTDGKPTSVTGLDTIYHNL